MTLISPGKENVHKGHHRLVILILTFTISFISALILSPLNISLTNHTWLFSYINFYARTTFFQCDRSFCIFLFYFSFPFTNTIVFSIIRDLYPIVHYLMYSAMLYVRLFLHVT